MKTGLTKKQLQIVTATGQQGLIAVLPSYPFAGRS